MSSARPTPCFYLLPLLLSLPLLTLPLSHPALPFLLLERLPHPVDRLHILPTTYGGTGNQIYFLLEAIHLARATDHTLLLPPPPPRNLPRASGNTSHHLNTTALSPFVKTADRLPRKCRNRFDHIIRARRGGEKRTEFSSRELAVACHYTRRHPDTTRCGQRSLRRAVVHDLLLPLSHVPNLEVQDLLRRISGCVLLDGHSYNRAGEKAHEALHSYLHYLEPTAEIRDMAAQYDVDAVVHLRYDEHECFRKRTHREGLVCVRVQLSTSEGVVRWVKPEVFVSGVVAEARRRELRNVYLAFSPYVPVAMARKLERLFRKSLSVVPRVEARDHEIENLVERQLATEARLFVGDFGSTWSGTVYYKRRTLRRETVWACRLLELCEDLGYYRFDGILRKPEWFESVGIL